MSARHAHLGWLPVERIILYRRLRAMNQGYSDPPVLFGPQHTYSTRCMLMLTDVVDHEHKHFFAIREQSGGVNFLNKSFLSVTLCPLFIITYCILIKLYV